MKIKLYVTDSNDKRFAELANSGFEYKIPMR